MKTASSAPNFNYGFPTPGPQTPSPQDVMNHVFFASHTDWKQIREDQQFDYIVIGSGFCALGFAERTLKQNPHARILILERGPFFLPEHFQNLPLPYQRTLGGLSETFPWTLSARTHNARYIKWQHGMVPFFGGRSIMWSSWCPRPTVEEMADWPKATIEAAHRYFEPAEKLLNVISASELDKNGKAPPAGQRPIFGVLQAKLTERLQQGLGEIPSATRVMAAPLAVNAPNLEYVDFLKYATPGPLLELVDAQQQRAAKGEGAPLTVVTECIVERILQQDGTATALETSRGVVAVGKAQLILAMGTLPATTLVLNSFPQAKLAGERFTAHFISSIIARVPRADYEFAAQIGELELGAIYLAGEHKATGGQYHIQLTVLSDRDPVKNAATAAQHMPDVVATATPEQLQQSKDYVVFVCAVLGEIDYRNRDNWFRRNDGDDPTTNVTLQVIESENDSKVWQTMEEGTFQALERVLSPQGASRVEYWHPSAYGSGSWKTARPAQDAVRVPGLVHEGSTMWIGEGADAVVGLDYKLNGAHNVYVTGASLWPASGSWNPTMTMVALSQDLADRLNNR